MNNNSLSEIFDNGVVRIALVGVLAILALFLLAQTITSAAGFGRSGIPATDTITVHGDGQAVLPPDVARISFTIDHTATTVADAQAATTKQANAALDYLKGKGIAEKDIKTLYYNITQQYSYPNPCPSGALCPSYIGAPKVIGYDVSETMQVTVHDLSAAGELIGGLGKLGVQNLSGPQFTLEDTTSGHDAARADAIAKAKAQAVSLANQLGVRLGKIVNFSESSGGYPSPMAYGMGGGASDKAAQSPVLPTGENTYSASVSVTYEIR